jgi:hypothetical protein
MTGLSRETVTRALDVLQKEKRIKIRGVDRNVILLPDFFRLGSIP